MTAAKGRVKARRGISPTIRLFPRLAPTIVHFCAGPLSDASPTATRTGSPPSIS
jgi:hypothetical protein